jgi:magnesium transporter
MARKKHRFKIPKQKPFAAPGTLTYVGKEVFAKPEITCTVYTAEELSQFTVSDPKKCTGFESEENKLIWLDVNGVHQPDIIEQVGKLYHLHPLLLEDVLNTTQKPKIEYFEEENQLFVVLKMLQPDSEQIEIESEQIALVLGKNYVISFQEYNTTHVFENIHERIKRPTSRIRKYKSDYLIYALIDLIVDYYYVAMEQMTDQLEDIEMTILTNPKPQHQNNIYQLKKEMNFMKRNILPLRDMISALIREESDLVGNQVNVYLRDVQDHVLQTIETLDTYREVADNIMSNYHASLSNKMNSVMKTLTVFTVIFMPLSFIAGIYGMNFANMPELNNPNGYYFTLGGMLLVSIGLWFYFKWKKYI